MEFENHLEQYARLGYTKISKAIDKKLLLEINNSILDLILKKKFSNLNKCAEEFEKFIISYTKKKQNLFKLQEKIFFHLEKKNYLIEILKSENIHSIISKMLGPDLEFKVPNEFIINISKKEKKNYLFKKFHQEVWSGASTNTTLLWIPIFQKNKDGQMKLIKNSHLWGHIPHHNKEPIKIPKDSKYFYSDCSSGDILIFHTLTLHSSVPLKKSNQVVSRLSMSVRNFKYPKNGYEDLNDWKKYSYSANTIIEKQLGNPYLSPFRLSNKNILKNSWQKYKFK